tara:strand:+ start:421 stop:654 length:234 start_codon:yes stop_codon:yes gene_type:complete
MKEVKPGSSSTEYKVVVLNYIVGCAILGAAIWMQREGQESTQIMTIALGFLGVNGLGYGTLRTVHKNKVAENTEIKS